MDEGITSLSAMDLERQAITTANQYLLCAVESCDAILGARPVEVIVALIRAMSQDFATSARIREEQRRCDYTGYVKLRREVEEL